MGAQQSTRRLTVINDEASGVIKVCDLIVEYNYQCTSQLYIAIWTHFYFEKVIPTSFHQMTN
jgi:hypothetical protein